MRDVRKLSWCALAAVAIGAGVAQAAPIETVQLTLVVDTTAKTWSAYEQNSDASQTSGLAGISFDVVGSGGIGVDSSFFDLPFDADKDGAGPTGFGTQVQNGFPSAGLAIQGFQPTTFTVNKAKDVTSVYLGVGNQAETVNTSDDGKGANHGASPGTVSTTTLTDPVLIGDGTFTGTSGALTISSSTGRINLLPAQMPTATTGGAPVLEFQPRCCDWPDGPHRRSRARLARSSCPGSRRTPPPPPAVSSFGLSFPINSVPRSGTRPSGLSHYWRLRVLISARKSQFKVDAHLYESGSVGGAEIGEDPKEGGS